jgi:DNA end-binding protein Ku
MALERSAKVVIAKYAWSGRERLGLLRVRDDAIVLHAMRWPDEIRSPQELAPDVVEISEDEIEGAQALIDPDHAGHTGRGSGAGRRSTRKTSGRYG